MSSSVVSDQEGLKLADNAVNEVRHLIERFKNRLTSDNLRLSERYIQSQLKPLVCIRMICGCGNSHDLVIGLQRLLDDEIKPNCSDSSINAKGTRSNCCGYDEPVFIGAVELVDIPERIVATNVCLYCKQHFFAANAHLVYFSLTNGRCVLLGTLADREVGVPIRATASSFNELTGKMVERAPHVVDGIADCQCNFVWDGVNAGNIQSYVRNLTVLLDAKRIGLRIAEGADSTIQVSDVLFGPFNFESDSMDAVDGHRL